VSLLNLLSCQLILRLACLHAFLLIIDLVSTRIHKHSIKSKITSSLLLSQVMNYTTFHCNNRQACLIFFSMGGVHVIGFAYIMSLRRMELQPSERKLAERESKARWPAVRVRARLRRRFWRRSPRCTSTGAPVAPWS